jgi:hypothetical protein
VRGKKPFQDLTGKRFGRLTAIVRCYQLPSPPTRWLCRCTCGNWTVVRQGELHAEKTQSCGCLQRERTGSRNRIRPYESLYHLLAGVAKRTKRKVMSYRDFLYFTEIPLCWYCGGKVEWTKYNARGVPYNLDRRNNTVGYLKTNCVVCCGACNSMKSDTSYEDFLSRVHRIAERFLP